MPCKGQTACFGGFLVAFDFGEFFVLFVFFFCVVFFFTEHSSWGKCSQRWHWEPTRNILILYLSVCLLANAGTPLCLCFLNTFPKAKDPHTVTPARRQVFGDKYELLIIPEPARYDDLEGDASPDEKTPALLMALSGQGSVGDYSGCVIFGKYLAEVPNHNQEMSLSRRTRNHAESLRYPAGVEEKNMAKK